MTNDTGIIDDSADNSVVNENNTASANAAAARQPKGGVTISVKTLIPVAIVVLLLLIGGIVAGVYFMTPDEPVQQPTHKGGAGLVIDPNAGEHENIQVTREPPRNVAIPGWSQLSLPANEVNVVGYVDFYNPEYNDGYFYMTFELRLPDDSEQGYEVLYTSQLVPAGDHIQRLTLTRGLSKGTYDAILHIQPYTQDDDPSPVNSANIPLKLIVERSETSCNFLLIPAFMTGVSFFQSSI